MKRKIIVKLISPKMSLRPMDSDFKRMMAPSLSLITIASLTPSPNEVYIEDENIERLKFNDFPDLVGITVNVDTSKRAFEIANRYRKKGIKVIFGGIHASANPDLMLKHCDSVVIGEAEELWHNVIDDFKNNKLKDKYFNPNPTNLEKYPFPRWDFINKNKYLYNNIIITSRGCPFKCDFCYNSSKYIVNSYRNRPVEKVIEEIKKHETNQIMIIDDNFIGNIRWTKDFIREIKPLGLTWHAAVSANLINHKDLIDDFEESGCRSLFIGFETINGDSIKSVRKNHNKINTYEELINILHSKGIMVNASMVFGFDNDKPDVFGNTLEWLVKNKIETMTAHILTPYPGTVFYNKLLKEERIFDFDLSNYNTSNVVFRPKNISKEELRNGYLWIYKEFYTWKNIIKRTPENRKIIVPFYLFNLVYRKYGKMASWFGKLGLMNKIGRMARKLSYGID